MLMSMTGYCSFNEQILLSGLGMAGVTIEIKTLNGRFFEVVPKLSSVLSPLEVPIINYLQERFIRGRVYLNIRIDDRQAAGARVAIAWPLVDQYVEAAKKIQMQHGLRSEISPIDLLLLPNVVGAQEGTLTNEDNELVMSLVAKGADRVLAMRRDEGVRLQKDFERLFTACKNRVLEIERCFNVVIDTLKERIRQSIAAHGDRDEQNTEAEELQVTLKKIDIHEEIVRFKSHLAVVQPLLDSPQIEKGKKLDFILQELLRETNTMMAKCPSYEINATCIDTKVDVEKAREQAQNIV